MTTVREEVEQLLEELERQRDELKVKLHLAKAEIRDEWEKLEHKRAELRSKLTAASGQAEDAWKDIGAAAGLLADELKKGYDRIRSTLT